MSISREFLGENEEEHRNVRKKELDELSTVKAVKEILAKALGGEVVKCLLIYLLLGGENDNIEFSPITPNVTAHQLLNPNEYDHDNSD
mmetsp:Transcript_3988/g.4637  ORF Transcript_3988/g.4637 Transcript_3988/m.4637 type:complete len:88 (+) Transcript_3988:3-266(+)